MSAKILVTGSGGFIGSHLIHYLQGKNYTVTGINVDIRDKELLSPHFRNMEFVVHTAGKKYNPVKESDFYTINVLGTKNIAELCLENGSKLIHLSSIATEEAYGRSKQISQSLVRDYCIYKGLKAVILRLCVIYNQENNTKRRGARYPLEKLVIDIENIINNHDFTKYKLIDFSTTIV